MSKSSSLTASDNVWENEIEWQVTKREISICKSNGKTEYSQKEFHASLLVNILKWRNHHLIFYDKYILKDVLF